MENVLILSNEELKDSKGKNWQQSLKFFQDSTFSNEKKFEPNKQSLKQTRKKKKNFQKNFLFQKCSYFEKFILPMKVFFHVFSLEFFKTFLNLLSFHFFIFSDQMKKPRFFFSMRQNFFVKKKQEMRKEFLQKKSPFSREELIIFKLFFFKKFFCISPSFFDFQKKIQFLKNSKFRKYFKVFFRFLVLNVSVLLSFQVFK